MTDTANDQSEIARKSEDFLEYLQVEKGASPLTLRNYRHYLTRLNKWLGKEGIRQTLKDINQDIVRSYRVFFGKYGFRQKNPKLSCYSLKIIP